MKRSLLPALFGVAVLVAGLNAQEKPNFVGKWKLADEASADMFTPPQMAVAQEGNTLTVTTTGQMGEITTTYNMDGTEARIRSTSTAPHSTVLPSARGTAASWC